MDRGAMAIARPSDFRQPVSLRPVSQEDVPFLYGMAVTPDSSHRWLFRGATPSPDQFAAGMHDGVYKQRIVEHRRGGAIGVVVAYNADETAGTCFFAAAAHPEHRSTGRMLLGVSLFIDELFEQCAMYKLYMEVAAYNLPAFASASRYWRTEARLRLHRYYAGDYWDVDLLAVYRDAWRSRPRLRGIDMDSVLDA